MWYYECDILNVIFANLIYSSLIRSYSWIVVYFHTYIWASSWENMSSGVSEQGRLKLACSATEASMRLEILVTETRDITLSRQWTTEALIRLRRCAGWSALYCSHMTWDTFSHGPAIIHWFIYHRNLHWENYFYFEKCFFFVMYLNASCAKCMFL